MNPSHSSKKQKTEHVTQQTVTPPSIHIRQGDLRRRRRIHIDEFDESYVRLWKVFREAIEPLFSDILLWVNPGWNQNTPFKDYLKSRGVNISQIKKSLDKKQYDKLMSPSPEDKWDITMTYVLFQLIGGLARKNADKWYVGKGSDPELSLTCLKNLRNETAHSLRINKVRCSNIIKEAYELTYKIQEGLKVVVDKEETKEEMETVFDNTRQKIDEIGKVDIGAEAFDEYQRELNFLRKKKLVVEKGLPSLKNYLEKSKSISPLDLITRKSSNLKIPVEKIFTEMKLEGESGPCSVPMEDILNHVPHDDPSRFLLIKGLAGMGKTTLVKKIISDWLSKKAEIKGLNNFDLLLHVECKENIKSFKDLLVTCLGDVHQIFQINELIDVCLALKCLVIADGFDELNDKSSELFQDVLTLKKSRNLSVIVTTRPEFEEKFNDQVKSDYTTVSTINLEGIPEEKREEFVCKYYAGLGSEIYPLQSLDKLLLYLKKTMPTMLEVWGLPLNLTVVIILWMNNPGVISNITTEAELYLQMFFLYVSKLKGRLEKNQLTSHLPSSVLENKTKQFIEELCRVSLNALKNDEINIPMSTIKYLTDFCHRLGVPAEELTGAFLKKVTTSQDNPWYSFPHKGIMEFMAAYYIFMKVTHQCWNQLSSQPWADALKVTDIPPAIQDKMLKAVESEPKDMAPTVTNIFKRLHDGSLPETLHKYQNMLIQMISIFHVDDGGEIKVSKKAKIEGLKLLERSGVDRKDSMLKVLKNIKFDSSSTRWIAKRFKLFDGDTRIQDNTIDAYIALLRATDAPLPNRDEINIIIHLRDTAGLNELSIQLRRTNINPIQIHILNHYTGESTPNTEETESIKNLLTNDCEYYQGIWSPTFPIPPNMRGLRVRLPDHPSLDAFCESLEKPNNIDWLVMHFSVNDVSRVSQPIPFFPHLKVLVSDVKEGDIEKVGDILRAIQQQDEKISLYLIGFPRCSLRSPEEFLRLLDSLEGVRVTKFVCFPRDKRPADEALFERMRHKAEAITGCNRDLAWWTDGLMFDYY